jgi:GT2 family glycosyltransferase
VIEGTPTTERRVSVVVPTCADPRALERALASILCTGYRPLEIVVVENRPPSAETRHVVEKQFEDRGVRYVEEVRRGLSSARNAGLAAATGEFVAFADDDVVVDPSWIRSAVDAFESTPAAACVTGRILPLTLESATEQLFDQFAALDKGTDRRVFRLPESRLLEPLFPYAAGHVGSGANIFLRRDVALQVSGFDPLLGAGTPAVGGEDLDLFIRLAYGGHVIVYDPAVLVRHEHPQDRRSLRRHAYHYGIGLTAVLTKQLYRGPERRALLRAIPAGLRYWLDPNSRKNVQKSSDYPKRLDLLEGLGLLVGPISYAASLLAAAIRKHRQQAAGALTAPPDRPACR